MKKTEQIAVHLSGDTKEVLMLLAEQNGNSVSEFVCDLIEADLKKQFDRFSVLKKWMQVTGSVGTDSTG